MRAVSDEGGEQETKGVIVEHYKESKRKKGVTVPGGEFIKKKSKEKQAGVGFCRRRTKNTDSRVVILLQSASSQLYEGVAEECTSNMRGQG